MIDSFTRQPHHYKPQETTECRLDRAVELIGLRGLHFIALTYPMPNYRNMHHQIEANVRRGG